MKVSIPPTGYEWASDKWLIAEARSAGRSHDERKRLAIELSIRLEAARNLLSKEKP